MRRRNWLFVAGAVLLVSAFAVRPAFADTLFGDTLDDPNTVKASVTAGAGVGKL